MSVEIIETFVWHCVSEVRDLEIRGQTASRLSWMFTLPDVSHDQTGRPYKDVSSVMFWFFSLKWSIQTVICFLDENWSLTWAGKRSARGRREGASTRRVISLFSQISISKMNYRHTRQDHCMKLIQDQLIWNRSKVCLSASAHPVWNTNTNHLTDQTLSVWAELIWFVLPLIYLSGLYMRHSQSHKG